MENLVDYWCLECYYIAKGVIHQRTQNFLELPYCLATLN